MRFIKKRVPPRVRHHFTRNATVYQIVTICAGMLITLGVIGLTVAYFMFQEQRETGGAAPYTWDSLLDFDEPASLSPLQRRQALNRILENSIAAHGGHHFVDRLRTVQKSGTLTQNGTELHLHYAFKRPDRVRYRLQHGDRGSRFGFDGNRAWRQPFRGGRMGEARPLEADDASGLVLTSELAVPAVLFFEENPYMSLIGVEAVGGHECFVVEYTGPLLPAQRFYIDRGNFVVRQRIREARLRGDDPTVVSVLFDDFRAIDGILFPHREIVKFDDEIQTVFEIDVFFINPGILDEFFEMPGEG